MPKIEGADVSVVDETTVMDEKADDVSDADDAVAAQDLGQVPDNPVTQAPDESALNVDVPSTEDGVEAASAAQPDEPSPTSEPADDALPERTAMVVRSASARTPDDADPTDESASRPAIVPHDPQRQAATPMVSKRKPEAESTAAATQPANAEVPGMMTPPTGGMPLPGAVFIGPDGMPVGPMGPPPNPMHMVPGPGGPMPVDGAGHHMAPPPGLEHDRLVRRPRETPTQGWRHVLHRGSGGLINLGKSRSEQHREAVLARVRQPIRGDYRVAVMSLKGGVGKTTVTVGLGSSFSSRRGDRVIAVDANPDLGTLASRVPQQTTSTVRTLLNAGDELTYTDIRRHTSQAPSRLEVLASERDPAISESFSSAEYREVLGILESFYNIIMTDCGTGLLHSAMEGVLSTANAIVLVTSPAVDGAQSASATLDWLNAHGYAHLARQAVVVISASKPGSSPVDVPLLTRHFLGRTRAVHHIPYDPHLATGAIIDLERLHRRTQDAFLELAATVADSFASTMINPPYQGGSPAQQPAPPLVE